MTQDRILEWLRSWEALLAVILVIVVGINISLSSNYLSMGNLTNLFQLFIEKAIIVLIMAPIIINGEIDLSVGSVLGLAGCSFAYAFDQGLAMPLAIAVGLSAGMLAGVFNGLMVSVVGLPSLAVTLAGLIGYRGLARVFLEDRSITDFPEWFDSFGQDDLVGPFPISLVIFAALLVLFLIVLHLTSFGRHVYIIGNNKEAARFSGLRVMRVKMILLSISGLVSALAGILYAARLGTVRGDAGTGFELDIITIVLLGGVSIFGGRGSMVGVALSVLVVLNIRNGMSLVNLSGEIQTSALGALLILSVLIPNLGQDARRIYTRAQFASQEREQEREKEDAGKIIYDET